MKVLYWRPRFVSFNYILFGLHILYISFTARYPLKRLIFRVSQKISITDLYILAIYRNKIKYLIKSIWRYTIVWSTSLLLWWPGRYCDGELLPLLLDRRLPHSQRHRQGRSQAHQPHQVLNLSIRIKAGLATILYIALRQRQHDNLKRTLVIRKNMKI